jgi:hypothetical protein
MPSIQTRETTTEFILQGTDIQKSLQSRISRHKNEVDKCLTAISDVLKAKSGGTIDNLATNASAVMLVLTTDKHLTADALIIKTQLERASFLSQEQLDLSCIAKNIDSNVLYKVTLEEAKRYGLV